MEKKGNWDCTGVHRDFGLLKLGPLLFGSPLFLAPMYWETTEWPARFVRVPGGPSREPEAARRG